jgi:hypothetical protein
MDEALNAIPAIQLRNAIAVMQRQRRRVQHHPNLIRRSDLRPAYVGGRGGGNANRPASRQLLARRDELCRTEGFTS